MLKQWFPHARKGNRPLSESGVPPLTGWERFGAAFTALGGAAVGGLGFYASFDAVSAAAETWGFVRPWVLPVAIDSAIPVFTAANLYLIRLDMALAWVRFVPWVLSLITCALNVAAGHSLWAKVARGAISLLWVGVSEVAAHIYAVRIGAVTGRGRRLDKVRWKRWLLATWPTFLLWRRNLWELESYDAVLRLEHERLVYEAKLRGRFGRGWRRKAPVEALLPLRLARNGIPLAQTAPSGLAAAGIDPSDLSRVILPLPGVDKSDVPKPTATPTPAASPAPPVLPAVRRPRSVRASAPPQPQASIPLWSTEGELYEIIKDAIDNGRREVFNGPLTGKEIGLVLGKHPGEGRKVRGRLIETYAATKGIIIPDRATLDDVFVLFSQALTSANP
ncbi:hypothetical protein SSP531S_53930 [Streptomyces spongiicola]|uniref:DUF2637 domain-containing protein n=1 Tax=Streptomyces spongiicola TaxID=1690221 RepID=A0A388T6R1_9ACTN|nr:DUF2637 domain-containing protein [Streptomyces spongiicola]GBQ03914.1 hypothetical protein SSP531S_53930 [Streptomyces spongiicola]